MLWSVSITARPATSSAPRRQLAASFHQILAAEREAQKAATALDETPIVIHHDGTGPAVFHFEFKRPGDAEPTRVAITIEPPAPNNRR